MQGFKLRYVQMRKGGLSQSSDPAFSSHDGTIYQGSGHTRNLCPVWPDGKRMFFNYSYLISGEYNLSRDKKIIRLYFSKYNVEIQGYCMENLFLNILDHTPKILIAIDQRYATSRTLNELINTDMSVKQEQ